MNAQEIHGAALQIHDPQQRAEFIDSACGPDADLRRQVEQLGHADRHADRDASMADTLTRDSAASPADLEGTVIGRYKCLQKLGEGAMGVVFMAEQTEPVRRRVALKLIKPGMDSAQVLARFEAERQALALMNHDHIARVFDAGTVAGTVSGSAGHGRPYFVMELVKGVPLTRYCNEQQLPIAQRLELFVALCHAVQHAHQKGIIHRDLKPSNVLVALVDGQPVPKIIDFGLAKAMHQPLTERTMFTSFGSILGTLEYMSPEQADLGALDIDTRTDLYSLGVMLYELLTGTTPLAHARLREKGYAEAVRLIREVEPVRPSTQLTLSGERGAALAALAAQRRTDPAALRKLVRGDLDWIAMKALDKNRGGRYQTASEFAADVERMLKHEPILARPPSLWYPLQKFLRRHRAAVAAALLFVLLLVGASVVSTWLALRARDAERDARAAEVQAKADQERAVRAEKQAEAKAREAKDSAAIAQAVNDFLRQDVLAQANPFNQFGVNQKPDPDLALRTVLDRAAAKIPGRFPNQPLLEGAIRKTIGETYSDLSLFEAAQLHLEAAVALLRQHRGEAHPDTVEASAKLGNIYWQLEKFAEAEKLQTQALEQYRRALGENHRITLETLNNLGLTYQDERKFELAEAALLRAYEGRRKYLGDDTPETLNSLNCLGWYYYNGVRRFERAEPYYVKALALRRKVLPAKHPHTQHSVHSLALLYNALGKYDAAEPLYREALAISRETLGADGADTVYTLRSLGQFLAQRGQFAEAERHLRESVQRCTRAFGAKAGVTIAGLRELAACLLLKGDAEEALVLSRRVHALVLETSRNAPLLVASAKDLLATALLARAQYAQAEAELTKSLALYEQAAPDHWLRYSVAARLGESLALQKKFAQAEPLLLQGYEGMKQRSATIPAPKRLRIQQAGAQLIRLYEAWGMPAKAKQWRDRLDAKAPSAVTSMP